MRWLTHPKPGFCLIGVSFALPVLILLLAPYELGLFTAFAWRLFGFLFAPFVIAFWMSGSRAQRQSIFAVTAGIATGCIILMSRHHAQLEIIRTLGTWG